MKFVLKLLTAVVLVVFVTVFFAGGGLVKYMINFHSKRLTGLEMSVAGAELSIPNGQLTLSNLAIANPDGFNSAHAATIDSVQVKLQPKSIFEDVIVVDYIGIKGTRVQFEGDLNKNNVQSIQEVLARQTHASADGTDEMGTAGGSADDGAEKKLAIRQLSMEDTKITFHLGEMAQGVSTDVSDIELTNIGTADNGATAAEVLDKILRPLFENMHKQIVKAMSNPEGLLNQVKDKLGGMLEGLF